MRREFETAGDRVVGKDVLMRDTVGVVQRAEWVVLLNCWTAVLRRCIFTSTSTAAESRVEASWNELPGFSRGKERERNPGMVCSRSLARLVLLTIIIISEQDPAICFRSFGGPPRLEGYSRTTVVKREHVALGVEVEGSKVPTGRRLSWVCLFCFWARWALVWDAWML
jgi:hypothetical protein